MNEFNAVYKWIKMPVGDQAWEQVWDKRWRPVWSQVRNRVNDGARVMTYVLDQVRDDIVGPDTRHERV